MELIGIKILKMRFLDEFGGIPYHIDHMGRESQEIRLSMIYGTPGPGTGWSGSVGNFKNFVGHGPIRDLELLLSAGSQILKTFLVLVWSEINRFLSVDPLVVLLIRLNCISDTELV